MRVRPGWDRNRTGRWQYIQGGITRGWVHKGRTGHYYGLAENQFAGATQGPDCLTLAAAQAWVETYGPITVRA